MSTRPHTDLAAAPVGGDGEPAATSAAGRTARGAGPATPLARLLRFGLRACVLYTVLTVASSVLALAQGQETDTHVHLLARLAFVLIGLGAFELVDGLRRRYATAPVWLVAAAGYVVAIVAIMVGLWVFAATGGELHPNAYRDAFWNFSAVGLVVIVAFAVRDAIRSRRRR